MTTIVVDQEMMYIAADRMATSNDGDVACEYPKIRRTPHGLIACAGNEGPSTIFEEWFEYGAWDEPLPTMEQIEDYDSFTAIMLLDDGIWVADKFMRPYKIHSRWYAAGTGGPFAWAVLVAGCGIHKAMETAIKMDNNSGYGFDVEYFK